MFEDLRECTKRVEQLGELKVTQGADWNLEIGAITEIMAKPDTRLLALIGSKTSWQNRYFRNFNPES